MAKPKIDISGWLKKKRLMREGTKTLQREFVKDVGAYFIQKLTEEVIAGPPGTIPVAAVGARTVVGVQSGNLRRSQTLTTTKNSAMIKANLGIAPYAPKVAEQVFNRHGKDYLRVTLHYYGKKIRKAAKKATEELAKDVGEKRKYNYENPF